MRFLIFFLMMLPEISAAESVVAARTIRAQSILAPTDVVTVAADIPGALTDPVAVSGLEARVTLYAGRPVRPGDLGPAAVIDRNQTVPLVFVAGPLTILTEGRALDRGGIGDLIRVMNLASRTILTGQIAETGTVHVGQQP